MFSNLSVIENTLSVFLSSLSINLPAFYHEWRSLLFTIFSVIARENEGAEREAPSSSLICRFSLSYFRVVETARVHFLLRPRDFVL